MIHEWKLHCTKCYATQDTTSAVCDCSCHKIDFTKEFSWPPHPDFELADKIESSMTENRKVKIRTTEHLGGYD